MKKNNTSIKLKIEKFFSEQLWQLLLVVAFLFITAFIFDKYIESVLFCISHHLIRYAFKNQFHCGKTAVCLTFTFGIGWLGISNTFPLELSLVSCIPICFIISFLGFIAQDRLDLYVINKELKEKLENKGEFNTDTCTKDELIARCRELKFSEENTNLAIEFFIKKTKQSKIADELCVDESTIRIRKLRLKKKLNKNNKK